MVSWFLSLFWFLFDPRRKIAPMHYEKLYAFGIRDRKEDLCSRYFTNITKVNSIDDLRVIDILLRRIRVISIPDMAYIKTARQKIKRLLLKVLMLSVSSELNILNIQDYFLGRQENKIFFLIEPATANLIKFHMPSFSVKLIKGESKAYRLLWIYLVLRLHKKKLLERESGVTIFACYPNRTLIKMYKMLHPSRKVILRLHNRVEDHGRLKKKISKMLAKGEIDVAESYYRRDAELLNIAYRPNGVNVKELSKKELKFRSSLYFFLGAKSKSREKDLLLVEKTIQEIYPNIKIWTDTYTPKGSSDWIPYEDYLEKEIQSEVIVDLVRVSEDEGFSYRIPEALALNRKIITNRLILLNEPFYSPDRIFIIGVDSLARLKPFLELDNEKVEPSTLSYFDSTLWWSDGDPYL